MKFRSRISLFILIFSLISLLSALSLQFVRPAEAFSGFLVNLKYGDTSTDVQQLQILLNKDLGTQVATTGPGSPGQETTFFGPATLQAVIKFQDKFASQILTPAGLVSGTGYVGPLTRTALNTILAAEGQSPQNQAVLPTQSSIPVSDQSSVSGTIPTTLSSYLGTSSPRVFEASPYEVAPSATTTLLGFNFLNQNSVYFDGVLIASAAPSFDGSSIQIVLPATTTIGQHSVVVTNQNGTSQTNTQSSTYIDVMTNPLPPPVITSVLPTTVNSLTQMITITGSGFTSNNSIYTGLGSVSSLASSNGGTVLTFSLSQLSNIALLSTIQQKLSIAPIKTEGFYLLFDVTNENGSGTSQNGVIIEPQ